MPYQKKIYPYRKIKKCLLCESNIDEYDHQDTKFLSKFLSPFGKIQPASRTGLCRRHQKKIAKAIKNARQLSLLKY